MRGCFTRHHLLPCLLFLLLASAGRPAFAGDSGDLRIEPLPIDAGVSHNLVYCMLQDRDGLMWFGTMYGLVKYDGVRYTTYRHDPNDPNSLSYDDIIALYQDSAGDLWIGTWGGGLNKFDLLSGRFTRYLHQPDHPRGPGSGIIWSITETREAGQRSIWLAVDGAGLDRLILPDPSPAAAQDAAAAVFRHYLPVAGDPDALPTRQLKFVFSDSANRLWAGHQGGLCRFIPAADGAGRFVNDTPGADLPVNDMIEIARDRFLLGTGGGVVEMRLTEGDSADFRMRYRADTRDPASLIHPYITRLLLDRSGTLWCGTPRGLSRLDRAHAASGHFINYRQDPDTPAGLPGNAITALCEDQSGIIWVGAYYSGLYKLIRERRFFTRYHSPGSSVSNQISALAMDISGNLWVGTTGQGLWQFPDSATDDATTATRFRHYPLPVHHPSGRQSISAICPGIYDPRILWLGTPGSGLIKMQPQAPEGERYRYFRHDPENSSGLPSPTISAITEAADPLSGEFYLWAGTPEGLCRIPVNDLRSDRFTVYQSRPGDRHSLPHHWITALYTAPDGTLWIGSYGGLSRYDWAQDRFENYTHRLDDPASLSNNYVYAMHHDRRGRFWIATSNGLNLMDPETGTFRSFLERDGLPNGVICAIEEDEAGRLWLSTHKGLSRFDPFTETFRNYDAGDGLQSNIFSPGVSAASISGALFFGGINGFNRFDPKALQDCGFIPPVRITAIRLGDRVMPVPPGGEIQLGYRENRLSFEFAALDYGAPHQNRYQYRLTGADTSWTPAGSRAEAGFAHLAPGRYTFQVRGSNRDGVWNPQPATLRFVILPPFWQTGWFYILAAAGLLLLVYTAHRRHLRRELRQLAQIQQTRQQERERMREKTARDYHDALGHQLTKISIYSELIRRHLHTSKLQPAAMASGEDIPAAGEYDVSAGAAETEQLIGYLGKITAAAGNLNSEARDFIWALNPGNDSAYETAAHLKRFGEELFEDSGIDFRAEGIMPELETVRLNMDWRRHLVLIFKEAMHNSLKHARAKRVSMQFSLAGKELQVRLSDDGRGMSRLSENSGNGLRNMRKRAGKIGGVIQLKSVPGEGTEVCFSGRIPELSAASFATETKSLQRTDN